MRANPKRGGLLLSFGAVRQEGKMKRERTVAMQNRFDLAAVNP
jgi:hypothetical protein